MTQTVRRDRRGAGVTSTHLPAPGYNYRSPDGSNPGGPQLPSPPNNGWGGGGAALEYHPGRPGNYTRDIAVDVTELQNGNGKGSS
jgi:hypothetical protein